MRSLIVLAAMLLSGCWMGSDLYSPDDDVAVLAPGTYQVIPAGGEPCVVKLAIQPNGQIGSLGGECGSEEGEDQEQDTTISGFVPIGSDGNQFVMWSEDSQPQAASQEPNETYYLAERRANGELLIYAPACDGVHAEIARSAGAIVKKDMVSTCVFPTRGALESAMSRLRPSPDQLLYRLVPVRAD